MPSSKAIGKRNLLLAFDAFGTLYKPNVPIPQAYGRAALRHGIQCAPQKAEDELSSEDFEPIRKSFGRAFKGESARNPNYGKATGLGAEKWWASVITHTFRPFLKQGQNVPDALISDLLTRYSTHEGYTLFPDVLPFFQMLRSRSRQRPTEPDWRWDKTVVGIITNSDDRVPFVLESFGLKIGPRRIGSSGERIVQASMDDDVSFVVLSYDVGFEKPDRRMFDAATQMLQETLADSSIGDAPVSSRDFSMLYVGDSLEHDYLGAREAGWDAVLVDRFEKLAVEEEQASQEPMGLYSEERAENGAVMEVVMCNNLAALAGWQPGGLGHVEKHAKSLS
ncbi:haloacid dehalogenase [Lentithecium fluviatile CBS 122367]|uniref:Haloacid dehalogenase n=1 Tax=Lentithecium fluviatile CBS 122367 TaxID=1168545 RepID=A0A6G1IJS6_9PLEO|nr:haloacid dehalogenase [Lentithecium fluviatile CBS 122367]